MNTYKKASQELAEPEKIVSPSHQFIMFYKNIAKIMVNLDQQKHTIEETKFSAIVHSFFLDNELPTIQKILQKISENPHIPNLKKTTLGKVLKSINFRFKKRCRNSVLKEKNEIISWRRRYLRCIKQYKQENRSIFYLDETYVNVGHTVDKVWRDMSITSARQAHVEGLSTGLKHSSGKGKILIVLHIGSKDGFVDNGLLLFESKKTGDYHEDMNSDVFEQWLQRILPPLPQNAVIVLDNAPYHSRKYEKMPTSATRKADIQSWLR
ncbi:uncharacterized protein LOC126891251 [Diabrotica virgifera virgifera]|uniref:Tc1-like transposase DDE domain-containing protein n=1 Tax=Diabrotica virgifera virgifera TaxID=50390 RepID=A0ABM5L1S3_DIAVI|nr:uncharacterized protein LOC126891251 [Diabrotica virgifera virgifera]